MREVEIVFKLIYIFNERKKLFTDADAFMNSDMCNMLKKAVLITNGFLGGNKYSLISDAFTSQCLKSDVELTVLFNSQTPVFVEIGGVSCPIIEKLNPDFVIFWDKDIFLAQALEELGFKVFNSSHAIKNCDDKRLTHRLMVKNNILTPKTIFVPFTFENVGYNNFGFLDDIDSEISYPLIIKECFGSFGMQVFLAGSKNHAKDILKSISGRPAMIQKLIPSKTNAKQLAKVLSSNTFFTAQSICRHSPKGTGISFDVRVCVVGNEAIASMVRYSQNGDFRANVTGGGAMIEYSPTAEEAALAIDACNALGLDFGGVDLLYDGDKIYVCEVNSNAHFKNISDCTGVNVAEKIINYILASI